ncbi:hypothetical protein [Jidongwangia harbinensis]|uniref:hypothetical protein n=1 Tax=Jidongwangia harbinensis TaxID=2878561 RepID=UPI001CDA5091|nr:hypothetical protein [Jidongwangia harbinensis]MCA2217515.1 hypothetical protein [Jidongwangia harbinensis]
MPAFLLSLLVISALSWLLVYAIRKGTILIIFVTAIWRTPTQDRVAIIRALAEFVRAMRGVPGGNAKETGGPTVGRSCGSAKEVRWAATGVFFAAVMVGGGIRAGWWQALTGDSAAPWAWVERTSWIFGIAGGVVAMVAARRSTKTERD